MDDVWARLCTATHNDEALLAFLQRLLTLDPEARADFGELVETHPYLQPASQPVPVPGSLAASSAAASTAASNTVAVYKDAVTMQVAARLDVDKDVMQRLQSLPGLASVWWDPTSVPVCHLSSGSVYRYMTLHVLGLCSCLPAVMCCPSCLRPLQLCFHVSELCFHVSELCFHVSSGAHSCSAHTACCRLVCTMPMCGLLTTVYAYKLT